MSKPALKPLEVIRHTSRELVVRFEEGCKPCGGDIIAYLWRLRDRLVRIRLTCLDQGHKECLDGDQMEGTAEGLRAAMEAFVQDEDRREVWH
jgi:hypothetical protein